MRAAQGAPEPPTGAAPFPEVPTWSEVVCCETREEYTRSMPRRGYTAAGTNQRGDARERLPTAKRPGGTEAADAPRGLVRRRGMGAARRRPHAHRLHVA